jgi:hypothetical protein
LLDRSIESEKGKGARAREREIQKERKMPEGRIKIERYTCNIDMETHLMEKDPRNFRIDPLVCELFTVSMRNKIQNCMGIEEQIMKCASFYITRYDKRRER